MSQSTTMFNLGKHCEDTMSQKSVGGLITKVHICMREKGHQGPHRSAEGLIWINPKRVTNDEAN